MQIAEKETGRMRGNPVGQAESRSPERGQGGSRSSAKRPERETSDRWLRCRLDDHQADRLKREAEATNQTVASLVRSLFGEHWKLQEELASAIGVVGDEKRGRIIHRLLAETEERIAASYETALRQVRDRLDLLAARQELLCVLVAEAYRGFLLHTAEVPPEHREAFASAAVNRYAGYEEAVAEILARDEIDLPWTGKGTPRRSAG